MADSSNRKWVTDRGQKLDSEAHFRSLVASSSATRRDADRKIDLDKIFEDSLELLVGELKDERGVHVETILTTLGSIAGFSAQMAIRESAIEAGEPLKLSDLMLVETKNGEKFYFGDRVSAFLFPVAEETISLGYLIEGAAADLGGQYKVNIPDLAGHVAATVGGPEFGVPRLPPEHMPHRPPLALLDKFWNPMRNIVAEQEVPPLDRPMIHGLTTQVMLMNVRDAIDPDLAARIVMESAVPMSKVDPDRIYRAHLRL